MGTQMNTLAVAHKLDNLICQIHTRLFETNRFRKFVSDLGLKPILPSCDGAFRGQLLPLQFHVLRQGLIQASDPLARAAPASA